MNIKEVLKNAENGDLESQMELIKFYCNRRSKYSNPEKALYWMHEAQKLGAEFSIEQLAEVGDSASCIQKIEQYLFGGGKDHNFKKAQALMLKCNIPESVLLDFAKRYYKKYCEVNKEVSNICYLIMKAFDGNVEELNDYAVELTKSKTKNNMYIAFSLFSEAYTLGNNKAAVSYLYCFLTGKGRRRNITRAAALYCEFQRKGIDVSYAFASSREKGKQIQLPKSFKWRMLCMKHKAQDSIDNLYKGFMCLINGPLHYLAVLLNAIGFRALSLSSVVLLCALYFDWSWVQKLRDMLEELLPCPSWLVYFVVYIVLTVVLSLVFKLKDRAALIKFTQKFRVDLYRYGWDFPEFTIVSQREISRTDGCNGGSSTQTVEYILHFTTGTYQEAWPKKLRWNDSALEYVHATLERIDDNTVKVTLDHTWES